MYSKVVPNLQNLKNFQSFNVTSAKIIIVTRLLTSQSAFKINVLARIGMLTDPITNQITVLKTIFINLQLILHNLLQRDTIVLILNMIATNNMFQISNQIIYCQTTKDTLLQLFRHKLKLFW